MERPNEQRRRRNHGRQDNNQRPNERREAANPQGGGRDIREGRDNREPQRGRNDARPNQGQQGRQEPARAEQKSVERSPFSHYTREEKFPTPPVAPKRDYAPDPVTGQPIDNIYTALTHRESEQPVAFDTVVSQLRNAENLGERQQLIYVGSGQFGVYDEVEEGGKKRLVLVRKITYEDGHHKPDWRRELAPGISRDYKPVPEPLDRLYSPEEESAFPKIGAASGAYMPRNL